MAQNLPEEQARIVRLYAEALTGGAVLVQVVLAPLVTFILIYVAAAIVHLLLMLFRGAPRGFDATLTAVAHASGLLLLLAVPGCGSLLALVWGLVSLVVGLGAIQRCGAGKAAAAVLAPFALVCVCCFGAIGLTLPAFLKGAQDAAKNVQTDDDAVTLAWRKTERFGHAEVFAAIGLLSFLVARFLPVLALPFACPLRGLAGIPCATCGMTHAFVHLAHGEVGARARGEPPRGAPRRRRVGLRGRRPRARRARRAAAGPERPRRPRRDGARGSRSLIANWAWLVVREGGS